jgi:predicted nucleic acid-binding protein
VFATFADKALSLDASAAARYSQIVDARDRLGQPIDGFDAQIAAICRTNDYAPATRNTGNFDHTGVDLLDPWHDS